MTEGASSFVVPPAAEWPALQAAVAAHVATAALVPPLSFEELQAEAGALVRSAAAQGAAAPSGRRGDGGIGL
jgi:hypothetical protein